MIHINLHNYRKELKKIEIQKRVVKAISFVGIIVLLVIANWTFSQINLDQIRVETHKLEKAVKKLDPQVKVIQNCGHMIIYEKAFEMRKLVKEFLLN